MLHSHRSERNDDLHDFLIPVIVFLLPKILALIGVALLIFTFYEVLFS
ncbi:hypothetical protein clg_18 [Corynebacterium phage CL31]|nr:hypothetical protein clg_18 [Corynebacterium phage CL31]